MTRRRPPEGIGTVTPTEAIARVLVVSLFPEIEAALMRGVVYRLAEREAMARHVAAWEAQYGRPAVLRAWEIMERLGPATVLTPYGRELFDREYPLVAIPRRAPPEANDNIRRPGVIRQFLRSLIRSRHLHRDDNLRLENDRPAAG